MGLHQYLKSQKSEGRTAFLFIIDSPLFMTNLSRIVRDYRVCFLLPVVFLFLCSSCRLQAAQTGTFKPMGAWFSLYQKLNIDDELVWPQGASIETHYYKFDIRRMAQYSAVLIGPGSGARLSAEETAAVSRWVEDGGTLILTGAEPSRLWGNALPAWVAGEGATFWWRKEPAQVALQQQGHPLLQGLQGEAAIDGWKTSVGLANLKAGVSLVGDGNVTALFENRHGKGRVLYADTLLVPQAYPKTRLGDMTPLMKRFWSNLVEYLAIPSRQETIATWAATQKNNEPLTAWVRFEEEKPLGGRLYNPPHPTGPDVLTALHFDNGIGEINRKFFFATSKRDFAALRLQATDLIAEGGAKIPAAQVRIWVQEKPLPDWPKSSYWLVEPEYVAPLGSPAVAVKQYETNTYWVAIDSGAVAPGHYRGSLEFHDGGNVVKSLPLDVKVWPLHQPGVDVLQFEMEHNVFTLPGGYYIRKDQNDPALLKKYLDDIGRLGVSVGQAGGDLEKGYYHPFTTLRADGRSLEEAIKADPQRFQQDPLPSLSLSGQYDGWWNDAIAAGMQNYAQSWLLGVNYLTARIYPGQKLSADSPENMRISQWLLGEYRKYLRERGLLETYIKVMDEFPPEKVPEYIRSAAPAQKAGFKTYTTTYNLLKDKAAIAQMDPYTDMWQIVWPLDNLHEFFAKNNVPFDKQNDLWGTTASSFWGQYIDYPRGYGWEAARLRMGGLHVHGYLRWQREGYGGVFVGPEGPFDSVAVATYAQSVSEGRYLAQLYRLIDFAKSSGRGADVARQIEMEIARNVIGVPQGGANPLIPLVTSPTVLAGIETQNADPQNHMSPEVYAKAKVQVFEMLLRLQKAMADVKPDVLYDGFVLVQNGKSASRLVSNHNKAAQVLAEQIKRLAGGTPSVTGPAPGEVVVMLGTLQDAPVKALVEAELASEITPFYPRAGTYAIRRLAASPNRPATILVVGGDATGVETGARNLARLLTTRNRF